MHIPPTLSAAVVLCLRIVAIGAGCLELGRPALAQKDDAPAHRAELQHRVQNRFPCMARFSQAAAAVNTPGAAADEQKQVVMVELRTNRVHDTGI